MGANTDLANVSIFSQRINFFLWLCVTKVKKEERRGKKREKGGWMEVC